MEWINDKRGTRYSDIDALIRWAVRTGKGITAIYRIVDNNLYPEHASEFKSLLREYLKMIRTEGDTGGAVDESRKFHTGDDAAGKPEAYDVARGLVEAAGIEVVEVDDATAQAMLGSRRGDERLMGSRTDKKMERIAGHYADRELDENQRKVVDVFSGKADNQTIEVERAGGIQKVVMRQGTENKAGTKHSLYRHFETRSNYVTAADIERIPEVIAKGERSIDGKKVVYDYTAPDGSRLRVTTVIKDRREEFTNFLTNRKPRQSELVKPHEGNTQLSARASDAEVTDAKVGKKFSIGKSERDKEYFDALSRGDMETAQRMVDEAAETAGYTEDRSYQGTSAFNGAAPYNGYGWSKDERRELWKNGEFEGDYTLGDYIDFMKESGDQLDFLLNHPNGLRSASAMGRESIMAIREAICRGDRKITVYRSVPSSVKEGSLSDGDWVTPSKTYAKDNAAVHGWGRKYHIIEETVDFDDLWWDGNDINEWGFDSGSRSGYKNTRNNRKLLDTVTYDDQGNVIPLSQRFNQDKSDIRYLKDGTGRVYGWTVGGKVYLNRDAMNPETPLHEYTHLWDEMVMRENPELWERGKELMRRTPVWDEVTVDPNYADIRDDEDAVASEVHSRLTGARGAEILEGMIDSAEKDGVMATAEAVTFVERIKAWLADMFRALRKTLGKWSRRELDDLTAEDFTALTLRDLAEGMDPRAEMRRGRVARDVIAANPMLDDYHRGVRSRDDVLTFAEVLREAEEAWAEYGDLTYPDMDIDMLRQAAETGRITVYSSKPIATGAFVTPSRMNAEDYAGGGRVYSREVSVDEVAWTGEDEGQYAPGDSVEDSAGRVRLSAPADGKARERDGGYGSAMDEGIAGEEQADLEAKEKKYAEMDKEVADLDDITFTSEDDDQDEEESKKSGSKDLFRFAETPEDFEEMLEKAVAEKGFAVDGLSEKDIEPVEVERHDFPGERPISRAKEWAKENLAGIHTLTDSEGRDIEYEISRRTVDKYLSSSAIGKSENPGVHLAVLKALPEVIEASVEAEVHPDYLKGDDGKRRPENGYNPYRLIHRFYGAVRIDGKMYRVKTTINETKENKLAPIPHSFEVTEIELLPEDNSSKMEPTVNPQNAEAPHGIAKLLKILRNPTIPGKNFLMYQENMMRHLRREWRSALGKSSTHQSGSSAGKRRRLKGMDA